MKKQYQKSEVKTFTMPLGNNFLNLADVSFVTNPTGFKGGTITLRKGDELTIYRCSTNQSFSKAEKELLNNGFTHQLNEWQKTIRSVFNIVKNDEKSFDRVVRNLNKR